MIFKDYFSIVFVQSVNFQSSALIFVVFGGEGGERIFWLSHFIRCRVICKWVCVSLRNVVHGKCCKFGLLVVLYIYIYVYTFFSSCLLPAVNLYFGIMPLYMLVCSLLCVYVMKQILMCIKYTMNNLIDYFKNITEAIFIHIHYTQ